MTRSITHRIGLGDEIIATLKSNGHELALVARRDFGNITDVMRAMLDIALPFKGFAVASIRNKSQGWSTNLILASPSRGTSAPSLRHTKPTSAPHKPAPRQGAQYLIPW